MKHDCGTLVQEKTNMLLLLLIATLTQYTVSGKINLVYDQTFPLKIIKQEYFSQVDLNMR